MSPLSAVLAEYHRLRQSVLSAVAPSVEEEELGSKSLEDIADGFPTDLAMAALVETDRLLRKGHNCCVCEDVAAICLCLNCGDMFLSVLSGKSTRNRVCQSITLRRTCPL